MGFRTKHRVDVGSKAPDFTLSSQSGELVSLRDFLGRRPVVMVFQQYKGIIATSSIERSRFLPRARRLKARRRTGRPVASTPKRG